MPFRKSYTRQNHAKFTTLTPKNFTALRRRSISWMTSGWELYYWYVFLNDLLFLWYYRNEMFRNPFVSEAVSFWIHKNNDKILNEIDKLINFFLFKIVSKIVFYFQSGVPRTAYNGIVSLFKDDRIRVYITPVKFEGYNPKWN